MTTVAAKYLLTTEVTCIDNACSQVINTWKPLLPKSANLYYSEDNSVLELTVVNNLQEVFEVFGKDRTENLKAKIGYLLKSDFSQELLSYKEDVVPQESYLPAGDFLQLRHIEVPMNTYEEYLQWREKTIFKHVKKLANIDSFVAYHSLVSKQPGVMFVSSFSCEPEEYLAGFNNPEYAEIVKQAGDRFITGGSSGLYTKIYKRV